MCMLVQFLWCWVREVSFGSLDCCYTSNTHGKPRLFDFLIEAFRVS